MGVGISDKGRLASQILRAFRQLSPKGVAAEAARSVRLGVVGTVEQCQDVARYLMGYDPEGFDKVGDSLLLMPVPFGPGANDMLPRCDALLVAADCHEVLPGISADVVFRFESTADLPAAVRDLLRSPALAYAQIALARALPGIRSEAAAATIQMVSLENTLFVTSTSLGNIIPNPLQPLTSLAETIGDVVVLTANQLRMLFRLAAIYDQPMGLKQQAPEVVSIIGAAFGWRSIARELVAKIPLGAGVIPKAAIAFAGTWAVGDGIAFFYTTGRRLTKQELKERFDSAYAKGRSAAEQVAGRLREGYEKGRSKLAGRPSS